LGCFERSLISGQSRYDKYRETGDLSKLSSEAIRGMALFNSEKCGCSKCHSGINFTNYAFENNGMYTFNPEDGRYRVTLNDQDMGKFKVPTLRNIEYSAPYMHDGTLTTLEDVIRKYEAGGNDYATKSPLIKGFQLSSKERNDLISFLKSLSDRNFITNPEFSPEDF
ncbi:MAG TPA: c-type cytochrome, partial [Saprospiraceae bacterium]|nr:c-type cytochrome [Saprospiraceae bacterium]